MRLLLGTDMAKDRSVLEAAYDDARGVTAAFNMNLLLRINRELGADFQVEAFEHRAIYHADLGRVEMHLVSTREQTVTIAAARAAFQFAAGETIHTESSHKYTPRSLRHLQNRGGFRGGCGVDGDRMGFACARLRTGFRSDASAGDHGECKTGINRAWHRPT